jgi:hypothetical protein
VLWMVAERGTLGKVIRLWPEQPPLASITHSAGTEESLKGVACISVPF